MPGGVKWAIQVSVTGVSLVCSTLLPPLVGRYTGIPGLLLFQVQIPGRMFLL